MTSQSILITGSSGTIGTRLAEKLLEKGHQITGIDRQPNKWQPSVQEKTIVSDLLHPETFNKIPDNIDLIVHLAANARVYDLVQEPRLALENFQTTFNVLEYARQHDIKKVIFASSREVYGNQPPQALEITPTAEAQTHIDHIESPYSASKYGGEALVQSYYQCYDQNYIIFRFSNVYGMYDDSDRVIPLFIRQSLANQQLTVFGEDKLLDFTYIDDAIAGIISAIENFNQAQNDTYNLAYGEATSLIKVAELIKENLPDHLDNIPLNIQASRTGEVMRYLSDTTNAQAKLNFHPQTPIHAGISKSVQWYLTQKLV